MSSNTAPEKKNDVPLDATSTVLTSLAREYEEDNKLLRYSFVIAAVFHIVLFMINFPEFAGRAAASTDRERRIFVVQQPKFRPPEQQQQQQQIMQPRTVRVPIPDPTPDEPRPVRQIEPVEEIPYIPDDIIFGVPDAPPSPEPEGPVRVGGQIREPRKLVDTRPSYPEVARRARIEGVVILELTVDRQGSVRDVQILRGLPMGLTEAAVDAVRQWRYEPTLLNGRPIEVLIVVTVNFRLQ